MTTSPKGSTMSVDVKPSTQLPRGGVTFLQVVAAGRIALGSGMMLFPKTSGGLWMGRDWASQAVARYHTRINGGRETALGVSLLTAADRPEVLKRLLWVGALFDTWDACTALFAGRCLGTGHRQRQAVVAPALWVTLSLLATRQIDAKQPG
jgi:hypothetical protein